MKYLFCCLILFVLVTSCKKENEYQVVLPQETTTGQNSLGFLYNGAKVWSSIEHGNFLLYNKPDNIPNATATLFHETNGINSLQLKGQMSIKNNSSVITSNSSFNVTIQNFNLAIGNFNFDTLRFSNWVIFKDEITSKYYNSYTNNTFSLLITSIDTAQKIVSGKFSGNLYNKIGTTFILDDSVKIQQGRFDIKYTDYR